MGHSHAKRTDCVPGAAIFSECHRSCGYSNPDPMQLAPQEALAQYGPDVSYEIYSLMLLIFLQSQPEMIRFNLAQPGLIAFLVWVPWFKTCCQVTTVLMKPCIFLLPLILMSVASKENGRSVFSSTILDVQLPGTWALWTGNSEQSRDMY